MHIKNKRAFTLIELLIVIAIIGILFVVLVSKVDFATDKAKTTGVQTDFRSFQVAFETVSRENSGFNTLGWDTGDNAGGIAKNGPVTIDGVDYTYANAEKDAGDRVRNSYDVGDLNLNGKRDADETFTGRKIYTETWTSIYTLDNPGNADDKSAYIDLENAINKNLDPKLHITINPADKTFNMKNGYQDPWTTEYHGFYLTNAVVDGKDRGAIVMYSDGPNKVFGSEQTIAGGVVNIVVPGNNIKGADDLSIITCYTYYNGYGENVTTTVGFSNNQSLLASNGATNDVEVTPIPPVETEPVVYEMLDGKNQNVVTYTDISLRSSAPLDKFVRVELNDEIVDPNNYTVREGSTIITFKKEFLATLPDGDYEVSIISEDGVATTNMTIDYDSININKVSSDKFILLDGSGLSLAFLEDNSIQTYYNGVEADIIPAICVIKTDKYFTITGTGQFDGTFTICSDGYIDLNGYPVAKSEKMWITKDENVDFYFVVHNNDVYISYDGNHLDEYYINISEIGASINNIISDFNSLDYQYKLTQYNEHPTIKTIFDALALNNVMEKGICQFDFIGLYHYYGGSAYDTITDGKFVTNIKWSATQVDALKTITVYLLKENTKIQLNENSPLQNGVYLAQETIKYYHDGKETTNIMIFEDYALYFEDGMTYREWLRKYGCTCTNDYANSLYEPYYFYIPEQYLDDLCEKGYGNKLSGGWETGFINSPQVGFYSGGIFHQEKFFYSYGLITFKQFEAPEGYTYVGLQWDGGLIENGTSFYADEIFNYYIRNNLKIPSYIDFEPIFEPIN